jgi:hypothetical protein
MRIREALDNTLAQHLRGSVSFVNFPDGPPERTLDLGCGVSLDLDLFTSRTIRVLDRDLGH